MPQGGESAQGGKSPQDDSRKSPEAGQNTNIVLTDAGQNLKEGMTNLTIVLKSGETLKNCEVLNLQANFHAFLRLHDNSRRLIRKDKIHLVKYFSTNGGSQGIHAH